MSDQGENPTGPQSQADGDGYAGAPAGGSGEYRTASSGGGFFASTPKNGFRNAQLDGSGSSEYGSETADGQDGGGPGPQPAPGTPVWESAAFDAAFEAAFEGTDAAKPKTDDVFDGVEDGGGYSNYAGVDMSGPDTPVKAGVPSSGNWQMPEWMREEAPDGGFVVPDEPGGGRGRVGLLVGVGVLVAALIAAGAVYVMRSGGGKGKSSTRPKGAATSAPSQTSPTKTQEQSSAAAPPDAKLARFPGTHTRAAGRITDALSGLSYPKLAAPWQVPAKKSGLAQSGWSSQQILVTEKHAGQIWYGQLMSGLLSSTEQGIYAGPGTEKAAAIAYEKSTESRLYDFAHKSKPLASQAIRVPGPGKAAKGWLVSTQLTYHRPGVKATGEILTVAIVNTGKSAPAVLFMSIPDTHKKLYPDINFVVDSLRRAA